MMERCQEAEEASQIGRYGLEVLGSSEPKINGNGESLKRQLEIRK
jgi:hypothetical protein